jgi:hypothetical protein
MRSSKINPSNLLTMSVADIISSISARVLADIPEGIDMGDPEQVKRAEQALGRLPNDYAYVMEMLSYSRHYVRVLKRGGADTKAQYEDMMDKRDALESIGSALKLQWQGVSRMLTMKLRVDDSDEMYEYRKERG